MNDCDAPIFSVVVPAYDEEAYLPATLTALKGAMSAQSRPGEVIVCDNNSTDRTAEVARSFGAQVVFERRNQISRARNAGAAAARGRYLLFLDADTVIEPEHLEQALIRLENDYAGGGVLVALGEVRYDLAWIWNRFSLATNLAAGCFLWVRAEAYREVGGFNEALFASEEIWFARKLKRWAKRRGLKFSILRRPVTTSNRKAQWFSKGRQAGLLLVLLVFPFAVRYRALMGFWYERPKKGLPKSDRTAIKRDSELRQ